MSSDSSLSYHIYLYSLASSCYFLLGLGWFYHTSHRASITKGIPMFSALSLLLMTAFSDKLIRAISVVVIELDVGPFPNVSLFASNLMFLWNVSFLYMILMLISNGWCVIKTTISPAEKQVTVITGAGMMLLEVLLVGQQELYSLGILVGFIIIFRVYQSHITKGMHFLNSQIQSIQVLNGVYGN